MKKSELSFAEGFTSQNGQNNNPIKTFDWDKAANIIREKLKDHPNLSAEAGLQRDWNHIGGVIFELGNPVTSGYTYLSSNWAIPTLILSWDDEEQEEIECHVLESESRFNTYSKWDSQSLKLLNNDGTT